MRTHNISHTHMKLNVCTCVSWVNVLYTVLGCKAVEKRSTPLRSNWSLHFENTFIFGIFKCENRNLNVRTFRNNPSFLKLLGPISRPFQKNKIIRIFSIKLHSSRRFHYHLIRYKMPICSERGREQKRFVRDECDIVFYDFDYYGEISQNCFCMCAVCVGVFVVILYKIAWNRSKSAKHLVNLRVRYFIILSQQTTLTHIHSRRKRRIFRCCCCKNRYAIINRILTLYNASVLLYCFQLFCLRFRAILAIAIHFNMPFRCQFSPNLSPRSFFVCASRSVRLSKWYFFFALIIIIHKLKAKTLFLWAKCMIMSDFGNLHMNPENIFDVCVRAVTF